jgi:four helix bundle protein
VSNWQSFDKWTLGKQFIEAADSIALNIAEGYGRFYYKENKMFNYYSRGSAKETGSCVSKAMKRNLISEQDFNILEEKLKLYFKLSYSYINSIGTRNDDK